MKYYVSEALAPKIAQLHIKAQEKENTGEQKKSKPRRIVFP